MMINPVEDTNLPAHQVHSAGTSHQLTTVEQQLLIDQTMINVNRLKQKSEFLKHIEQQIAEIDIQITKVTAEFQEYIKDKEMWVINATSWQRRFAILQGKLAELENYGKEEPEPDPKPPKKTLLSSLFRFFQIHNINNNYKKQEDKPRKKKQSIFRRIRNVFRRSKVDTI